MRVQFELSEDRMEKLRELMDTTGIVTQKDLFNNALTLFEWVVEQRRRGRIIASMDEEKQKYKELVMPSLSMVKQEEEKEIAMATAW